MMLRDPLAAFFDLDAMKPFIETRDPEISAELNELRSKLKFRSWSQDADALFENLDLKVYNQKGCTPYSIATYIMVEAYYAHKAWEPLATAYRGQRWPVPEFVNVFVEHASADGRDDLVEKVWRDVAETAKVNFLQCLSEREAYPELKSVRLDTESAKLNAIAAYDNLADFYRSQGFDEKVHETLAERDELEKEAFRKPLASPVDMVMDEGGFWTFLQSVRTGTISSEIDPTTLMMRLEELSGPTIRKFYSHYAKNMKRLYHWNVWALAYAARGGCSDDAFHDFRIALILKSDPDLIDLAIDRPEEAARHLSRDHFHAEWSMYSICLAAYLARTGKVLKGVATDLSKPKGREWDEYELEKSHSDLLAAFA